MFLNPWTTLPSIPPFVCEIDRLILDAEHQSRYALRCDMLPHAWIGDPTAARVLVLQLNPGFSDEDPSDESAIPAYRELVRVCLTFASEAPFWVLDRRLDETCAARWWARRLRPLVDALGPDADAMIHRGLSVLEYFPYHSQGYRHPPRLPSQDFTFQLVRRAINNGATIVVMRQWESWRAAVSELIPYQKVFHNPNPRQAALSHSNLGAAGFDAIVDGLRG